MANELIVRLSPASVPCNSAASATNPVTFPPQTISLQISVVNTSTDIIDLSNAELIFDFPVDPGGTGSAAALVLADPGVTPPAPFGDMQYAPTPGTNWTISPFPSSPCSFAAHPQPKTGRTNPGLLAGNGQGSVTFVFSGIAVDAVPGPTAIGVRLQGPTKRNGVPNGVTVNASGAGVEKTYAGFGITSFAASPLIVRPGSTTGLSWTTTGAASCNLSWSPPDAATVTDDTGAKFTNGNPVPGNTNPTAPFVATVNAETSFSLIASGAGESRIAPVLIVVSRPVIYLWTDPSPCVVPRFAPFTLAWSAFASQNVELSWDPPENATVVGPDGNEIIDGASVQAQSSASVSLTGFTTFDLIGDSGVSAQAVASLLPPQLTGLVYGQYEDPTGRQYVLLEWISEYATEVDVDSQTLGASGWTSLAQIVYPNVVNPEQSARADLSERTMFRITARSDAAHSPVQEATSWVTPAAVEIISFGVTGRDADWAVRHWTGIQLDWSVTVISFYPGTVRYAGRETWSFTPPADEQALPSFPVYPGDYVQEDLTLTAYGYGVARASLVPGYHELMMIGFDNLPLEADDHRG